LIEDDTLMAMKKKLKLPTLWIVVVRCTIQYL
jgi:hypothetical protein